MNGGLGFVLRLGLGGGGGAVFNPADLNPVAWYDFSDASLLFTDAGVTPVASDGDAIYQANDKSGSGFHLTQTTLAARPAYKTGIQNSKSIGRFDGVDDWLMNTSSVLSGSQNRTVFMVVKPTAVSSTTFILSFGYAGTNFVVDQNTAEPATRITGGRVIFPPALSTSAFSIIDKKLDGTDCADISTSVNGVDRAQVSLIDTTLNTGDGIAMGAAFNDVTLTTALAASFQGQDVAEMIVYPTALSASNEAQVTNYLNSKWSAY